MVSPSQNLPCWGSRHPYKANSKGATVDCHIVEVQRKLEGVKYFIETLEKKLKNTSE